MKCKRCGTTLRIRKGRHNRQYCRFCQKAGLAKKHYAKGQMKGSKKDLGEIVIRISLGYTPKLR